MQRTITTVLGIVLLAGLPLSAIAQDGEPVTPEGVEWTLTSYDDGVGEELVSLPFDVRPTLLLEDGIASGNAGCNRFSGTYELDGSSLSLSDELSVTLGLCDGPGQDVEDAYLAALGSVAGWSLEEDVLQLYDDLGQAVLTFEVPAVLWTSSQLASLVATLAAFETRLAELQTGVDTLRADTEALNVPTLRQRIRALESENAELQERVESLEDAPEPTPRPTASFSAAERVLLQGIPTRIGNRCRPLRSALPKGTRAAVSCTPNSSVVASVDYYLLEGRRAASRFGALMDEYNVEQVVGEGQTCEQGVKSQRVRIGGGWQAEGCYRENRRAQLRFVDNATDCRRLRVGQQTLPSPAFLIALQGTTNDVAALHDWATRALASDARQLTSITRFIPSSLGVSPSCPT